MKKKIASALIAAAVTIGFPYMTAAEEYVPTSQDTVSTEQETEASPAPEVAATPTPEITVTPGPTPEATVTPEPVLTPEAEQPEASEVPEAEEGQPETEPENEQLPEESPSVTPVPSEVPQQDPAQIPQVMSLISQWSQENGSWYYYDENGQKATGWLENGGDLYYLNADGSMATGWKQIDGKWYYFRSWGAAYRNEKFSDGTGDVFYGLSDGSMASNQWIQIGNDWYYFRNWGAAYHDYLFDDGSNLYYLDQNGVRYSGWLDRNGSSYCFDSNGKAYRNQWFDTSKKATSKEPAIGFYYAGSNGVILKDTCYKTTKDGGDYYYSFSDTGACNYTDPKYVRARDSVNGIYYVMEHQYFTDPQVSDRDLMAAICEAEAGLQRTTGMTAVAMVIRNRMDTYGYSMKTAIYKKQQFEPARNGSLTKYLKGISTGDSSIMQELTSTGAYTAADESERIMTAYKTNGTKRVIPNFGDTRADFDYLYFMTPAAFEQLKLDPVKCQSYVYTYKWTTSTGQEKSSSHIFFVDWVKLS